MKKSEKVNLGCGTKHRGGYVNVDKFEPADVVVDLDRFPWPFASGSVDEVFSEHWLEHVEDYLGTMMEIHRILRPGGVCRIEVPHFKSPGYAWPQEHRNQFGIFTFWRLANPPYSFRRGGSEPLFVAVRTRHDFSRNTPKYVSCVLNRIANIHPVAWDFLNLPVCNLTCELVK